MKTVALTVAVLALGLAACNKQEAANNAAETNVENAAVTDVNAASNDATANADVALNADVNAVETPTMPRRTLRPTRSKPTLTSSNFERAARPGGPFFVPGAEW